MTTTYYTKIEISETLIYIVSKESMSIERYTGREGMRSRDRYKYYDDRNKFEKALLRIKRMANEAEKTN